MEKVLIVQGHQNWHGSENGQFLRQNCEMGCLHRNSERTV